jgi:Na+/melibiose symporter-like transporter
MAAMGMPIAVYLPQFYAEGMGLDLITVGMVFTVARVWDVVTDPLMGLAIDRFETRWGRRKHWIALSIPILMLSVWMVFMPDPESVSGLYLGFWMIMLYVGYTMLAIAHQSWGAELAVGYDDRSRLFGWREIFIIGGMTAVLAIPAGVELLGSGEHALKVASMGWFCLLLFPLTLLPTLLFVPDKRGAAPMGMDWREAIRVVVANSTLWRLLAADLGAGLGTAVSGALYIFMATYVMELPEHASIALLFYFLASFVAMPFWLRLAYRVGKDAALKIALGYGAAMNVLMIPLAEPGNAVVLWSFTIMYGFAFGAAPTLLRSMMADVTDADELLTGQKRAGLFFALLTTTNKLGAAGAVGVSFTILEVVFRFVPGPGNSAHAIDGLLLTYTLGTAFGLLVGFVALLGYPLSRQKHEEIREQLDARAAAR